MNVTLMSITATKTLIASIQMGASYVPVKLDSSVQAKSAGKVNAKILCAQRTNGAFLQQLPTVSA